MYVASLFLQQILGNRISRLDKYKLKSSPKKECCYQCRHVMFKGTMTKWPIQKQTHRAAKTRITS